jgi:hypothetical protein
MELEERMSLEFDQTQDMDIEMRRIGLKYRVGNEFRKPIEDEQKRRIRILFSMTGNFVNHLPRSGWREDHLRNPQGYPERHESGGSNDPIYSSSELYLSQTNQEFYNTINAVLSEVGLEDLSEDMIDRYSFMNNASIAEPLYHAVRKLRLMGYSRSDITM